MSLPVIIPPNPISTCQNYFIPTSIPSNNCFGYQYPSSVLYSVQIPDPIIPPLPEKYNTYIILSYQSTHPL